MLNIIAVVLEKKFVLSSPLSVFASESVFGIGLNNTQYYFPSEPQSANVVAIETGCITSELSAELPVSVNHQQALEIRSAEIDSSLCDAGCYS